MFKILKFRLGEKSKFDTLIQNDGINNDTLYFTSSENAYELHLGKAKVTDLDNRNMISLTYSDLLSLVNTSKLIPGMQYRIVDYETIFDSSNIFGNDRFIESANHKFDIIVTAISDSEIDSDANAIYNDSDDYFANSDLSSWKLKYTIDNTIGCIDLSSERAAGFTYSRNDYFYTGVNETYNDVIYYEYQNSSGTTYYLKSDVPCQLPNKEIFRRNGSTFVKASTFTKCWNHRPIGKGIIYSMEDEFGNRCSYDFKNLISYKLGGIDGRYTFDIGIEYPRDQSLTRNVYNNIIGPNLTSGNEYKTNKIILLGECCNNTFGNDTYSITLNNSSYNRFGDGCNNITLKYSDGSPVRNLTYNSFGNGCSNLSITFADDNTSSYRYIECDCGMQGNLDMTSFNVNNSYTTIITKRPTGEIIYGSIEDLINTLSLTEFVLSRTYSELLNESNNGLLIPGMKYRITDFKTKCVSTTYKPLNLTTVYNALGIVEPIFDIIVTAVDESTLSEDASLAPHINATYHLGDIDKYKIKYCLYNSVPTFDWCASDGTGVIYYMKDNWGNEAYYDFKSIMFRDTINGNSINTFTFSYIHEDSDSGLLVCDDFSHHYNCKNNKIGKYMDGITSHINCVRFYVNDASYECANNIIGNNSFNILFSTSSPSTFMNNVIGNYCNDITFKERCNDNRIGNSSYSIILTSSDMNTIGDNCNVVDISSGARFNTIGDSCSSVSFNTGSMYNTIGHRCGNIQLGVNSAHNKIGSSSNNISIRASQCQYNVFGNNCFNITMSNNSSYNTFGENNFNIKAGAFFQLNTFGDYCNNIYFTKTMVTSASGVMDTNLRDYCQNNVFAKDTSNICFYKDCTSCLANRINNLNVVYPRQSTDTGFVPIEITNLNINYEMLIRRNSAGELRMFNLSDFVIE